MAKVVNGASTGNTSTTLAITTPRAGNILAMMVIQNSSVAQITGADNIGSTGWVNNSTGANLNTNGSSVFLMYKLALGTETTLQPTAGSGGTIIDIAYIEMQQAQWPVNFVSGPTAQSNQATNTSATSNAITTQLGGAIVFSSVGGSASMGISTAWTGTGPMTNLGGAITNHLVAGYYASTNALTSATFTANWPTTRPYGMLTCAFAANQSGFLTFM